MNNKPLTFCRSCEPTSPRYVDPRVRYCIECKNNGHVFECIFCIGRTANMGRICFKCLERSKWFQIVS